MTSNRPPRYDASGFDTRLSRLETITDTILTTLEKIQNKLDVDSKINWTPIGIGVTIFMAVVGSFSAIYTTRMNGSDENIKTVAASVQQLAVASTEQRISVQTLKDRQDDMKVQTKEKITELEDRIKTLENRR